MLTEALIRLGIINRLIGIWDEGTTAVFSKYDYKQGYRKRSEMDEYGKSSAREFTTTLKELKELKTPTSKEPKVSENLAVYLAIRHYLEDVENEILEKLSKVSEVIEKDAEPESVKEAIEILEWYRNLVEERTDRDRRMCDAIISRGRMIH